MLKGIDPNERIEHISKFDIDEPKTVFIMRPLAGIEIPGALSSKDDILKALQLSIIEIRNMPEGLNVEQYLQRLDLMALGELMTVFNRLNKFSEQEAKNS